MRSLRPLVPVPVRRLAAWLLPLPSRLTSPNVCKVRSYAIRDGIQLHVYWLDDNAGPGPAASLLVFGDEVMRFDCLGRGRGHMHLNLKQSRGFPNGGGSRLYYREQTIEDQIERSCFEFATNICYAFSLNASRRIRAVHLDRAEIEAAVPFLRRQMLGLFVQDRFRPELPSAGSPPMRDTSGQALDSRDHAASS